MASKKKALGRGLSALLENDDSDRVEAKELSSNPESVVGTVAEIPIDQIEANPFQPRSEFEEDALKELAGSIETHGIIQPVTVRMVKNDQFQLISGERRFRASQIAGLQTVPAYVRVADDQTMLEMALVENIQREDLNAIEVSVSYKRLIDECNITQEEVANRVSKGRATVTNYLRLLKLPAEVQLAIKNKQISMGHARALLGVNDKDLQNQILEKILKDGISVRQVEQLAKGAKNTAKKQKGSLKKAELSFEQQKHVVDLERILDHKVLVKKDQNGKGKLSIDFKDDEDLSRILDILNP
ncbi:ParB/RepB/Spo0J family partition protein [Salibacter sp.]|uniref:ParB/RepB/Spo0J family partition protein n=1 Tax=Salibacter sp. TaxID=2010995 RepID=UPI0028703799|nr:ParB/RepB/Spo0J family partition protein [Salibacter sp.]MDR9487631.1 ParB/RepB/Spo0J family partition protein [Salibacter sp.]